MYLKNFIRSLNTVKWPALNQKEQQKLEQQKRIERIWPKHKIWQKFVKIWRICQNPTHLSKFDKFVNKLTR